VLISITNLVGKNDQNKYADNNKNDNNDKKVELPEELRNWEYELVLKIQNELWNQQKPTPSSLMILLPA
jgi:hypothetical protein